MPSGDPVAFDLLIFTAGKASREIDSVLIRLTDIKTELNQVCDSIKQIESSEDYKSMRE